VIQNTTLNQSVCAYLSQRNYVVTGCKDAMEAYNLLSEDKYDMYLIDTNLSGMDGFELVEALRRENRSVPMILLSQRDEIMAKRLGFQAGADDYLVIPFAMEELDLRMMALARRANLKREDRLIVGKLVLMRDEMAAYIDGLEIPILPKEFKVLYKLLSHPKKIFSRSELLEDYLGMASEKGLRTVDVYITKIRKLFETFQGFEIVTVHGFGYKAILK